MRDVEAMIAVGRGRRPKPSLSLPFISSHEIQNALSCTIEKAKARHDDRMPVSCSTNDQSTSIRLGMFLGKYQAKTLMTWPSEHECKFMNFPETGREMGKSDASSPASGPEGTPSSDTLVVYLFDAPGIQHLEFFRLRDWEGQIG